MKQTMKRKARIAKPHVKKSGGAAPARIGPVQGERRETEHRQAVTRPAPALSGGGIIERMARKLTDFTGSTAAFLIASMSVIVWAALGPVFGYSNNWQMVINTATTIVTFLMVFLIQRAQNKDSLAIHLKLDELVAAHHGASNRLVSAEELSEEDLELLRRHYRELVRAAHREEDLRCAHSVDEDQGSHAASPRDASGPEAGG
jgi:low affinity Fe/Cu permease